MGVCLFQGTSLVDGGRNADEGLYHLFTFPIGRGSPLLPSSLDKYSIGFRYRVATIEKRMEQKRRRPLRMTQLSPPGLLMWQVELNWTRGVSQETEL